MSSRAEPLSPAVAEEERVAIALVGRGLITRDEVRQCRRTNDSDAGAIPFLQRLVEKGFLTGHQAGRAQQDLPLLVGQQIPGYELLERLGQGSSGDVYKARQVSMNRLVAIKILQPRFLTQNPNYIEKLTAEAHLAAKLSHNNIVQAIDVGSVGRDRYFVMEYVEGTTIKEPLEKGKIYEEKEAVEIVLQIAQALQHAHRRGLIHRDIKPANIILTKEGIAKLLDLGMARETEDLERARAEKGMTIGTPFYIAPEQIHGRENLDVRADIYSLGATFYHMVTGQPPFPGTNVDDVLKAHEFQELTPPDHLNLKLSSGLGEVVEFMMAKSRKKRYRTPDDLIIDLECLLAGEPPKLARQHIEADTLRELAEGDEAEIDAAGSADSDRFHWAWVAILGSLLLVSLFVNLMMMMRK